MAGGSVQTIFVVDDDEVVRDSLKALLETRRFSVVDFESGEAFLNDRKATTAGCVILDIHMPGISGLDVLKMLRSEDDVLPVILLTGRRDAAVQAQAEALGAFAILDKPIAHSALFGAVEQALGTLRR